jgi:YjzC-like protein
MADIGDTFRPGEKVPNSGIYDVIHDGAHKDRHQVTCVKNDPFPSCRPLRTTRQIQTGDSRNPR